MISKKLGTDGRKEGRKEERTDGRKKSHIKVAAPPKNCSGARTYILNVKSLITTQHNIFKSKFKFYNIDIDRNFPVQIKGDIDMLRDHPKKSRNRSIDIYIRAFDDISRYLRI